MTAPLVFEEVVLAGPAGTRIDVTVPARATVSVMGEVASGVQRLGAVALGLETPAAGRALVYGEDVRRMPRTAALAFRRRVGYVPEGDGLLQNLSLAENVALPLRFGSTLAPRELAGRLRVLLAAVRLGGVGELRPADADDEQRRRAALARALAFDPGLVILTEPFNGIGTRAAEELLALARGGETAAGARRAVFVTGQLLPDALHRRVDARYRVVRGTVQVEA